MLKKKGRLAISFFPSSFLPPRSIPLSSCLSPSLPFSPPHTSFFLTILYFARTCLSYYLVCLSFCLPSSHSPPATTTPHPTFSNHQSVLCMSSFFCFFLRFHTQVLSYTICLCLISLSIMNSGSSCVVASGRISFFYGWVIFHYVYNSILYIYTYIRVVCMCVCVCMRHILFTIHLSTLPCCGYCK